MGDISFSNSNRASGEKIQSIQLSPVSPFPAFLKRSFMLLPDELPNNAELRRKQSPFKAFVEGSIQGRAIDGGPACATVPLLGGGWVVAQS